MGGIGREMGNGSSSQPIPPTPPPPSAAVNPVITLPFTKSPTNEGASGLQYSGQIYANASTQLSSDLCNGATASVDQIGDVFPNGVSSPNLPIDDSTKRISATAIQGHVGQLVSTGVIPGQLADFTQQMAADLAFYKAVQTEYCFYEPRYVAALTQFIQLAAAPQGADSSTALQATISINRRLNSLLEVLNYVGNDRAQKVNSRSPQIDAANASLDAKIQVLQQQQEYLTTGDVKIKTFDEMMRYSKEKNHAMSIQIMFFVALNVVALGTVISVYNGTRPM
jgi:hypothetical protein